MNENLTIDETIQRAEKKLKPLFEKLDSISLFNQEKVLNVFINNKISYRHFCPTTGYGYDDIGRDTLAKMFSDIFGTEATIVSPHISCGSHALALGLLGLLYKPGKKMLSITGKPYDTLDEVIFGVEGKDNGSMKDLGVEYRGIDFKNEVLDEEKILQTVKDWKPDLVFCQRSRGYNWRNPLSINDLRDIIGKIHKIDTKAIIFIDNNYGEFIDTLEPTQVGADLMVGSIIKNIGGGIAPNGAYLTGKADLIEKISHRYTSPSLGLEVGAYASSYQPFFQGLFMSPHTTNQATKGCLLISTVMRDLGYDVLPTEGMLPLDIITTVQFRDKDKLISFCQAIQKFSPIDSFVHPEPSSMPGYTSEVIMAAGTFNQGSTIELSCDAPIKEPYNLYIQGGLTYEHVKIALRKSLQEILQID